MRRLEQEHELRWRDDPPPHGWSWTNLECPVSQVSKMGQFSLRCWRTLNLEEATSETLKRMSTERLVYLGWFHVKHGSE
jgi:hypothetical protein